MHSARFLLSFVAVVFLIGCVSSKEHKAKLTEIDNLRIDIATLEDKLSITEGEKTELQSKLNVANDRITDLEGNVQEISHERELAIQEKEQAIARLKNTYDDLVSELNQEIQQGQIAITQLKDRLSLSMVEKILFDSGSAKIKEDGKKVLARVGEILKKATDRQINIEGHTDNVPISSSLRKVFPTNWELSTARATNVVRYLNEAAGIDAGVLSAVGYGEFRPVASNETREGRARNRRIEIVLVPLSPAQPLEQVEKTTPPAE